MKKRTKAGTLFCSIIVCLAFTLFVAIIGSIALLAFKIPMDSMLMVSMMAQVLFLVLVLVTIKAKGIKFSERLHLNRVSGKQYVFPLIAIFLYSLFSNFVEKYVPLPAFLQGNQMMNIISDTGIILFFSVLIVAPIVEEVIFRGIIATNLRNAWSRSGVIILTALVFGASHLLTGSIFTAINAFFGALIFTWAYEKTDSLYVSIAAHIIGNLVGLVFIL